MQGVEAAVEQIGVVMEERVVPVVHRRVPMEQAGRVVAMVVIVDFPTMVEVGVVLVEL